MKRILLFLSLISLPFSIISNVKAASYASDTLKGKVVTSGDGLYEDKYNEGRYIYKGGNPNNFIKFNNELWRIISVEKDGTLKVIRSNSLDEQIKFQDGEVSGTARALNAWGKSEYYDTGYTTIYSQNIKFEGTVNEDSTLNKLLNNDYYNKFDNKSKCLIISKDYYFGPISYKSDDVASTITEEKSQIWHGKIALANVSDILLSTIDETKCGSRSEIYRSRYYSEEVGKTINDCSKTNYLMPSDKYIFGNYSYLLINGAYNEPFDVYASAHMGLDTVNATSLSGKYIDSFYVRPVTYLRNDMEILKGDGSENNPYEFKCDECDGTNNDSKNESNLIVDVPPTSMFISAFIIGGFILIAAICIVIYLKVFKKKDINK